MEDDKKRSNLEKVDSFAEEDVRGEVAGADAQVYGREQVALLIDASERAQTTIYAGRERVYQNLTLFQVAIKQVHDIVLSRLAFAVEDDIAIIFFNTKDDGQDRLGGAQPWHRASPPSIDLLDRLSSFNYDASRTFSDVSSADSFMNALIAAVLGFGDTAKATWDHARTKVVVWACSSEDAYSCEDGTVTKKITSIIEKRHLMLRLVALDWTMDCKSTKVLERGSMWSTFVKQAAVYDRMHLDTYNHMRWDPRESENFASGTVPCDDGFYLTSLKGRMKHNSITLDWSMGDLGTMQMKCFCFTSPAWPKCVGPTTWLDAKDSSLLINKVSEDVPAVVSGMLSLSEEELPYYPKQVGKKQAPVPRISIPKEDVLNLRFPLPKGMFLIGFKPRNWIRDSWQIREPYFMRPDDNAHITVHQKCTAIYHALVERSAVAVCGFVKSDQSEPRVAAVLPFSRSREVNTCPGFAVVELPFADDIRHPEGNEDVFGAPVDITEEGIDMAKKIVRCHQVHPNEYPGIAENPHIKRHFSLLEALLLDRPDTLCDSPDTENAMDGEDLRAFAHHHGLYNGPRSPRV